MKKNLSRRDFLCAMGAFAGTAALVGCGSTGGTTAATTEAATTAAAGDLGLVKEGTFTVALSPDFPPFENLDGDQYVGFDVELAKAVAEKLGLEVEFKTLQFDGIVPAISAGGQADCGWSGITIDPEREKEVDFSDPYYVDNQCVVTMKANADVTEDNYADVLNKEGVIIAVQSGTTGETYAQETFPNATVQPYGNATDCFAAMQSNQAVAVATNLAVGQKMVGDAYTDAQIIHKEATGEEYGVAVSKENATLLEAINGALSELTEDGTVDNLTNQWMG